MKFRSLILTSLSCISLSACVAAPTMVPPLKAEIHNKTKAQVADRIAALCQDYGFSADDIKETMVTCSQVSNMTAQVWLGTKYGSDVETRMQFVLLSPRPSLVNVTLQNWFEHQNAYGGVTKTRVNLQNNPTVKSIFRDLNDWSHE